MRKKIISLALLLAILFAFASCGNKKNAEVKPATPVEVVNTAQVKQSEPAKVVEEVKQAVQEVAKEAVVIKEEVKEAVEEVAEEVVEKVAEATDFTRKYVYSYGGYDINVEAHDGYGYVTYPSFITDAEISEALGEFVAAYGDFGVTFKKVAPGKLEVKYAEGLSEKDFSYIAALASESLSWYLDDMFAPVAEEVVEKVAEATDFTRKYVYSYGGYDINVEAHDGYGYVTYPSFITDAEISEALGAFVAAYGDFGVTFKKVAPGKLEVKYAEGLSEKDFSYIAALASESLSWYLDDMFAPAPAVAEPVVVPAATPVAAPVSTPATPVVVPATTPVEPVVDTTEKERCNSIRIAVRPINFLGQSDNVAYSAGAELTYEYRIDRHIGIANSIVYNAYIDKTNPKCYKADYALITDVVGYGRVSENTCLFLSLGVGLGEITEGTNHTWCFDSRVQFGAECHVSDLVAITASSAIQFHFLENNQIASYQPIKVGVLFSF